jgi:hypothetical protein
VAEAVRPTVNNVPEDEDIIFGEKERPTRMVPFDEKPLSTILLVNGNELEQKTVELLQVPVSHGSKLQLFLPGLHPVPWFPSCRTFTLFIGWPVRAAFFGRPAQEKHLRHVAVFRHLSIGGAESAP